MTKSTYEQKLGRWLLSVYMIAVVLIGIHWWQDALGEDAAWIWLCQSMGNEQCAPGQPWIKIQIGGAD